MAPTSAWKRWRSGSCGVLDLAALVVRSRRIRRPQMLFEHARNLEVSAIERQREERLLVRIGDVPGIDGAARGQVPHEVEMPLADREMERRHVVVIAPDERRARVDERRDSIEIAAERRRQHLPHVGCRRAHAIVQAHGEREPHLRRADHAGRVVNGLQTHAGRARPRCLRGLTTERLHERVPARELHVLRDQKLRVWQREVSLRPVGFGDRVQMLANDGPERRPHQRRTEMLLQAPHRFGLPRFVRPHEVLREALVFGEGLERRGCGKRPSAARLLRPDAARRRAFRSSAPSRPRGRRPPCEPTDPLRARSAARRSRPPVSRPREATRAACCRPARRSSPDRARFAAARARGPRCR